MSIFRWLRIELFFWSILWLLILNFVLRSAICCPFGRLWCCWNMLCSLFGSFILKTELVGFIGWFWCCVNFWLWFILQICSVLAFTTKLSFSQLYGPKSLHCSRHGSLKQWESISASSSQDPRPHLIAILNSSPEYKKLFNIHLPQRLLAAILCYVSWVEFVLFCLRWVFHIWYMPNASSWVFFICHDIMMLRGFWIFICCVVSLV